MVQVTMNLLGMRWPENSLYMLPRKLSRSDGRKFRSGSQKNLVPDGRCISDGHGCFRPAASYSICYYYVVGSSRVMSSQD